MATPRTKLGLLCCGGVLEAAITCCPILLGLVVCFLGDGVNVPLGFLGLGTHSFEEVSSRRESEGLRDRFLWLDAVNCQFGLLSPEERETEALVGEARREPYRVLTL